MAGTVLATARPLWGSVQLDVDMSSVSGTWFVSVERRLPGETTGVLVRSGDMIVAPGGFLPVWDLECPLDTELTYVAHPYTYLGEEIGGGAGSATVTSPGVTAIHNAWVKSVDDPGLSAELIVSDVGFLEQDRRTNEYPVVGRKNVVSQPRGLAGRKGTLEVAVFGWEQIETVEALFKQNRLLVQFPASLRIPDLYCATGALKPVAVGPRSQQVQRWTVDVVEQDRPDTAGWPLLVPGVSWASQAETFASWNDAAAEFGSWSEYATESGAAPVVTGDVTGIDNGDGTITWVGTDVIDNGDGTYTLNGVTATGAGVFTV